MSSSGTTAAMRRPPPTTSPVRASRWTISKRCRPGSSPPGRLRGRAGSARPARGSTSSFSPLPSWSRGSARGRGSGPGAACRACPARGRARRRCGDGAARSGRAAPPGGRPPRAGTRAAPRTCSRPTSPNRSRFMNDIATSLMLRCAWCWFADHVEARRRLIGGAVARAVDVGEQADVLLHVPAELRRVEGCQPMSIRPSVFVCHAALPTTVNGPPGRARRSRRGSAARD